VFAINLNEFHPEEESEKDTRFADSVDSYTVNDLKNMEKVRKRSQTISLMIRSVMIAICIGMMGYSAYMICNKMVEDKEAEEVYESLRVDEDNYSSIKHGTNLPEPGEMPTVMEMIGSDGTYEDYLDPDFVSGDKAEHYSIYYHNYLEHAKDNEDMYGWIYMTDTRINYPLMKGEDNDFYLNHNYRGEESRSGSIFADFELSDNYYSNYNAVVYGHNMRDGSMFNSLKKWCNSASIRTLIKTTQIEIYTKEGVYIYDILSYYVDNSNEFARTAFYSEEDYLNFLKALYKKSSIKSEREFNAQSKICTLITCTNGSDTDSRYVVHGILKQFVSFA
jgi:sortase B